MGKKKVFVILVLVLVLLLGWFLAFKAVTHMDEIKKQDKLVSQADSFMSRELYVRAIPLYEEATKIKTTDKRGLEVENKLLNAYFLHEDMDLYAKLVEKRADRQVAAVEEYSNTFLHYVENYRMTKAFDLIKKGIDNTGAPELKDLYEEYRYLYRLKSTKLTEIGSTIDNEIMPAFDGEKWGYIAADGDTVIAPQYDKVTAFTTDGIAGVMMDGRAYSVNAAGDKYSVDDNPNATRIDDVAYTFGTFIVARKDGKYGFFDYDFNPVSENCRFDEVTRPSNGVVVGKNGSEWQIVNINDGSVIKGGIEDVAVNSYGSVFYDGRGMIKIGGKWHLVDLNGNDRSANTFDNAKAPESAGYIAVANNADRWGFIDDKGELVIDYEYNDAYSFSDEVAAVQKYNDSWVYISKKNVPISEQEFTMARPSHGGVGQVIVDEKVELIIFRYYDK